MVNIQDLLTKATALKDKLDAIRPLPGSVAENLRQDCHIKNTYHSNAIEGNTLTLYETKTVLEDGVTIAGNSFREHAEANNHREALECLGALVNEDTPMNQRTIKDIHAIVLQGIDPSIAGKYRTIELPPPNILTNV